MKKRIILLLGALLLLSGCAKPGGQHVTPGYTRHEEGHWQLTNVLTFAEGGELRSEEKKQTMIFDYPDGAVYTVEAYWFEDSYYQSDTVLPGVNIIRTGEAAEGEDVVCTMVFSDTADGGNVLGYFKDDAHGGAEIQRFSIDENMSESTGYTGGVKYYISPHGTFPESEKRADGEKVYIVLRASDSERVCQAAWEYTWVAQPEDIEVPEQYGPIEYF